MRSLLMMMSVVALAGCDGMFETNDHEFDFPAERAGTAPTNVTPPPSTGSSAGGSIAGAVRKNTSRTAYAEIVARDHYTCALRFDETLDCWGDTLVDPPDALIEIGASAKTACGIDRQGAVTCWGAAKGFEAPSGMRLSNLGVGDGFACALDEAGYPRCWGPKRAALLPPADDALYTLAVGPDHACGLRLDGGAVCWGIGKAAQPVPGSYVDIAVGAATTCASTARDHRVICWGLLEGEQAQGFDRLAVTMGKACGIGDDGHAECWGLSSVIDWLSPPRRETFTRLSIGPTHACGIRQSDALATCWGSDTVGESRPPY